MCVFIHAHSQARNIILNIVQISTSASLSGLNTTINIITNPTMYINVVPCTEMGT